MCPFESRVVDNQSYTHKKKEIHQCICMKDLGGSDILIEISTKEVLHTPVLGNVM